MATFRYAGDQSAVDYGSMPTGMSDFEQQAVANNTAATAATAATNENAGGDPSGQNQSAFEEAALASQQTEGSGPSASGTSLRSNPLDDYVNYTYGLSLYALAPKDFNEISEGFSPDGKVLIVSGGQHGEGFSRAPGFEDDFYFENMKMSTVIGMNNRGRGSNVIDIHFTIVEPFGITLLNRLLSTADSLGANNWGEMPYLLQIDFFANAEGGSLVHPVEGQTKQIPLRAIECKIKASVRGSEYHFSAVPYSHMAFQENAGSTPAFHEVTAKTVKEFFSNEEDAAGSYTSALNSYQKKLADNKKYQEFPDIYEFAIDPDIEAAKIVAPKSNDVKKTPLASNNNKDANAAAGARAAKGGPPAPLSMSAQAISINAGTSIIDVINQVMRNCDYISNQVSTNKSGTIDWYRIIPSIEILEFDNVRKTYQKKYTYFVKKAVVYNTKYPDAPMSTPTRDNCSKEYLYMFTGQNQSILDFSIDFNSMFYTAMTANREKLKKVEVDIKTDIDEKDPGISNPATNGSITPKVIKTVVAQHDVSAIAEGTNDVKNVSANDLYKSIMSNSRGDMINVKLKISGDPHFIKQDDVFFKPTLDSSVGKIDGNGSLTTDGGELYVYLYFRTPTDIIQETGLYDFSTWKDSVFSGVYRILTIENMFDRGQFTQTLDLIRVFDQAEDKASAAGADGRGDDGYGGSADTGRGGNRQDGMTGQGALRSLTGPTDTNQQYSTANKENSNKADAADVDSYAQNIQALQNNVGNAVGQPISQVGGTVFAGS